MTEDAPMRPRTVLFLCTGNSARSIMAEAILRSMGGADFLARSAGTMPRGAVNPLVLEHLSRRGLPTEALRSKSWDEFDPRETPSAERLDLVVSVCDSAAATLSPKWAGTPVIAHWSLPDPGTDPTEDADDDEPMRVAIESACRRLESLIGRLVVVTAGGSQAADLAEVLTSAGLMRVSASDHDVD